MPYEVGVRGVTLLSCLLLAGGCGGGPSVATDAGTDAASADGGLVALPSGCPDYDIGSMLGSVRGRLDGERDQVAPDCAMGSFPDVAYRWTAPRTGTYVFDTNGVRSGTTLQAYAGFCGGPTLGCASDPAGFSRLVVAVRQGTAVVLAVDGLDRTTGDFVLNVRESGRAELECADGVDDDFDGQIDCADPDCEHDRACVETRCNDRIDDDGDGLVDCADPDCDSDVMLCSERDCGDGIDDDMDGLIDCADSSCQRSAFCREVDCFDGVDDDGDGRTDCDDTDCVDFPGCRPGERECRDGIDEDLDSFADCEDPECSRDSACIERICTNGVDDDGDGPADCDDLDCVWDPACAGDERLCSDGLDDDGDGAIDCADSDCERFPVCVSGGEADCTNGIDDDGDARTDCRDADCRTHPRCMERDCFDGIDDDLDGWRDCADSDCAREPGCVETDCGNWIDDDGDGAVDCTDPDCAVGIHCLERDCIDGGDDDGDGQTDCDDSECACVPGCVRDDGCPDIDLGSTLGSPAFHGTFVPRLCGPRRGSCGGAGSELTFRWVAPSDGMYYFSTLDTLGRGETFDTVLYLLDGGCTGPEIACNDDLVLGMMRLSELTVWLRAGQEIAIVLDSYLVGERGLFTVNIEPR